MIAEGLKAFVQLLKEPVISQTNTHSRTNVFRRSDIQLTPVDRIRQHPRIRHGFTDINDFARYVLRRGNLEHADVLIQPGPHGAKAVAYLNPLDEDAPLLSCEVKQSVELDLWRGLQGVPQAKVLDVLASVPETILDPPGAKVATVERLRAQFGKFKVSKNLEFESGINENGVTELRAGRDETMTSAKFPDFTIRLPWFQGITASEDGEPLFEYDLLIQVRIDTSDTQRPLFTFRAPQLEVVKARAFTDLVNHLAFDLLGDGWYVGQGSTSVDFE
jgi:hypothetical protein